MLKPCIDSFESVSGQLMMSSLAMLVVGLSDKDKSFWLSGFRT